MGIWKTLKKDYSNLFIVRELAALIVCNSWLLPVNTTLLSSHTFAILLYPSKLSLVKCLKPLVSMHSAQPTRVVVRFVTLVTGVSYTLIVKNICLILTTTSGLYSMLHRVVGLAMALLVGQAYLEGTFFSCEITRFTPGLMLRLQ